jgi:hypothetical protein
LHRNFLLKHVTEGKIEGNTEGKRKRGKRRKQLLDDIKGEKKKILEFER